MRHMRALLVYPAFAASIGFVLWLALPSSFAHGRTAPSALASAGASASADGPRSRPDLLRVHDAPSGWKYPYSCCSDFDCREVVAGAVSEKREGFVIEGTGELITHGDRRIRHSPDGAFHWCSAGGADDGRTLCLFVPPRSF